MAGILKRYCRQSYSSQPYHSTKIVYQSNGILAKSKLYLMVILHTLVRDNQQYDHFKLASIPKDQNTSTII